MPKFFVEKSNICENFIFLDGDNLHHIKKVLRLKNGDSIIVCDGDGLDYNCKISSFDENRIKADIVNKYENDKEPKTKITLFQGLPKGDKLSYIVEKCVEAGVNEITPISLSNCVVKLDDKSFAKKKERLTNVSLSASKQCGRGVVPKINSLIKIKDLENLKSSFDLLLFPYELEEEGSLKKNLKSFKGNKIGIIIGPEGGFSKDEYEILKTMGFVPVTLGKRILRTETAGVATIFQILYELEQ